MEVLGDVLLDMWVDALLDGTYENDTRRRRKPWDTTACEKLATSVFNSIFDRHAGPVMVILASVLEQHTVDMLWFPCDLCAESIQCLYAFTTRPTAFYSHFS